MNADNSIIQFLRKHFIALGLCLIAFVGIFYFLFTKYYHFGYADWDLAFFAQALWNISHNNSLDVSLFGVNFFSNHANLIVLVLAPFYQLFPHPLFLITFKILSFITAGFLIYLISQNFLNRQAALLLMVLYFCYPPNIFGMMYEFDYESLAPAVMMLMCYFFLKDRWLHFILSCFFLILIKENLPLVVCTFGLWGICTKKDKLSWGVVPLLMGIGSFLYLVFVFVPMMGEVHLGQHPYVGHYQQFGKSVPEVVMNIFLHPMDTVAYLMTPLNQRWFSDTIAPLLFLPLISPATLFLISPIIFQHAFASDWQEHAIYHSYMLVIAPFLFLGVAYALRRCYSLWNKYLYKVLIIGLVLAFFLNFYSNLKILELRYIAVNHESKAILNMISKIPPRSSIIATFAFLPELSVRNQLYAFHKIYDNAYQRPDYQFALPSQVRFALIDYQDCWLVQDLENNHQLTKNRIKKFFSDSNWVKRQEQGSTVLYERLRGGRI